ncbi:hypothetical protein P12x_005656 [Tundrisphaera lichenicola]|uniref:hypothetical protein n=1 Tax=Tundrisphaera lichenicola TaxID=2029860 RepID=UPI003EC07771
MNRRWPVFAIILATLVLAVILIRWADGEFLRIESSSIDVNTHAVRRPDWFWVLLYPYRRFQHGWTWACVAATVGMGAIVALDGKVWRRPARPGRAIVLVALSVMCLSMIFVVLAAPPIFRANGICYGLSDAVHYRVPGAILGAWVVTWGRRIDWRGQLVGWVWAAEVGMMIAYGFLFG